MPKIKYLLMFCFFSMYFCFFIGCASQETLDERKKESAIKAQKQRVTEEINHWKEVERLLPAKAIIKTKYNLKWFVFELDGNEYLGYYETVRGTDYRSHPEIRFSKK